MNNLAAAAGAGVGILIWIFLIRQFVPEDWQWAIILGTLAFAIAGAVIGVGIFTITKR